ncbi:MAG TPA: ABC transporter ATP-binding protein [Vampirovibrionales bacterium]
MQNHKDLSSQTKNNILDIQNLEISFANKKVVKGISFHIEEGQTYALVGESGSGKSLTCSAVLGLLPTNAQVTGSIKFFGQELLNNNKLLSQTRGRQIAYIPQNPITSLNPVKTVKEHLYETLNCYFPNLSKNEVKDQAKKLLDDVQLKDSEKVLNSFAFELSGGMCQRVMIALALAGNPKLLLADEPTTALDVTIQAEIMSLLLETIKERNFSMLLITHDLALVAQTCQKVSVIEAGQIHETNETNKLFIAPEADYTKKLLKATQLV